MAGDCHLSHTPPAPNYKRTPRLKYNYKIEEKRPESQKRKNQARKNRCIPNQGIIQKPINCHTCDSPCRELSSSCTFALDASCPFLRRSNNIHL